MVIVSVRKVGATKGMNHQVLMSNQERWQEPVCLGPLQFTLNQKLKEAHLTTIAYLASVKKTTSYAGQLQ